MKAFHLHICCPDMIFFLFLSFLTDDFLKVLFWDIHDYIHIILARREEFITA